jgi:hypothetical protein
MFNLKVMIKNKKEEKIIFNTELEKVDFKELAEVLDNTNKDKNSIFYIIVSVPQNEKFITASCYDKEEVIDIIDIILVNIDVYKNFTGIENIHIGVLDI